MMMIRTMMAAAGAALLASTALAAEIAYPSPRIFPESITVTAQGELITGSGDGVIWRARPGDKAATPWIPAAQTGGGAMFGVYADDKANILWVCALAAGASSLRSFDLTTGAPKATYPLPAGELCNDVAVARDGTVYASETRKGIVYRLRKSETALTNWFTDPRLAALDGIALGDDGALYLMTVSTPHAFRLAVGAGGAAGALTELALSRPMDHADGLRSIGHGRFLVSENGPAGGIALATIKGDSVDLARLPGGRPGTTSAVMVKGEAWGVIPRLDFLFNPANAGKDPGPFVIYSIPVK